VGGGSADAALRALRVVRGYLEDSERADSNVDKEWESKHQSGLAGLFVGWAEAHVRWRCIMACDCEMRLTLNSKLYTISSHYFL